MDKTKPVVESKEIEVSVVLPCLNEEQGISICIQKIKEIFVKEDIAGEIIVVDNGSVDRSKDIALSLGAKVLLEGQRGYGAAYLCGLKEVKGKYIIIGDSDNTYNFSDIPKLLRSLEEGYDFVIGSRFKGKMQKGAMPWLNRYVGNPLLSGLCRLFFRTRLSDIHCGMRAFTLEAYRKIRLRTLGMEFATEMVVAALQNNCKIREVPVDYHPRQGRSKLRPFFDAWRHIRFMLLYCPLWLYFIPGISGFALGMVMLLLLLQGPLFLFGHSWDLHIIVFASGLSILSYQVLNLGVYAHMFAIHEGFLREDKFLSFLQRNFSLEKGIFLGASLFLLGFVINFLIFIEWFSRHFGQLYRIKESIFAVTLLVIGLQTIFSSFFISLLFLRRRETDRA